MMSNLDANLASYFILSFITKYVHNLDVDLLGYFMLFRNDKCR
jgi:hypothetical protein